MGLACVGRRQMPVDGIRRLHTAHVNDRMRHRHALAFSWPISGIAGARFTGIPDPLGAW